jgi:hypothetical protein
MKCAGLTFVVMMSLIFNTFMLVGECICQTYWPQSDTGEIREIYGDRVYVQGGLGTHIVEMITPCPWCEQRTTVIIRFQSSTRANMVPDPNLFNTAPVELFIIKDGRESNL